MRTRAAAILIENNSLALIERNRPDGRHYFAFPGGGVDDTESIEQAVEREVLEELGLTVKAGTCVAEYWWQGSPQFFYLVEAVHGTFGSGTGPEWTPAYQERGTYQPVWMPLSEIPHNPVLPSQVAGMVARFAHREWPATPIFFRENG